MPHRCSHHVLTAAFAALLCIAVAGVAGACGGAGAQGGDGASAGAGESPSPAAVSPSPSCAPSAATPGLSGTPTVYLLGGSSARECLVSDAGLAAAVKAAGGPAVRVRNLGGSNQSYSMDVKLVQAMPAGDGMVLIGVSVGRSTKAPGEAAGYDAEAALQVTAKHRYTASRILTDQQKQALVDKWLAERYPLFKRHYAANERELQRLVEVCRQRGLRPVLLELPLNLQFLDGAFDAPRQRYDAGCCRLAERCGIPYVTFLDEASLSNPEFYDLMHLVEPGRETWQTLLGRRVARLLKEDDPVGT